MRDSFANVFVKFNSIVYETRDIQIKTKTNEKHSCAQLYLGYIYQGIYDDRRFVEVARRLITSGRVLFHIQMKQRPTSLITSSVETNFINPCYLLSFACEPNITSP